ncbi:MAG: MASE1 domain-containing protein, partial [Magnetococcales bacterium]|nr:MASE1 domain-containing protein [Magnetococcales bacterium]
MQTHTTAPPPPENTRSSFIAGTLFGLAYLATGILSKAMPFYSTLYPVILWLPAGVALAGFLLHGSRIAPGMFIGALLINLHNIPDPTWWHTPAGHLLLPLAVSLGGVVQAWLGAWLVRKFARPETLLLDSGQTLRLLVLGGPVACLLNASIGTAVLVGKGIVIAGNAAFTWFTWWIGDTLGVLLLTPLLLLWSHRFGNLGKESNRERRWPVMLALLFTLLLAVAGFLLMSRQELLAGHDKLRADAEEFAQRFQRQLSLQKDIMNGLAGFLGGVERLTPEKFRHYTAALLADHPEIQALEWAPHIPARERARLEQEARAWFPDYRITEHNPTGALVPAADR